MKDDVTVLTNPGYTISYMDKLSITITDPMKLSPEMQRISSKKFLLAYINEFNIKTLEDFITHLQEFNQYVINGRGWFVTINNGKCLLWKQTGSKPHPKPRHAIKFKINKSQDEKLFNMVQNKRNVLYPTIKHYLKHLPAYESID